MTRLFLIILLLIFPVKSYSLTFTENFSNLNNIDTANTNLTVITDGYSDVIFGNGAFYVSSALSTATIARAKFSKFDINPFENLICDAYVTSFYTNGINSLGYNETSWLIGGDNGTVNSWNGCTTSTCASNLSANLQSTNSSWATNTVSVIAYSTTGSYWLLGGTNGLLARYNGSAFTDLSTAAALSTNKVKAIAWNGSEFLIGAAGGNLTRYNGSTFTSCTSSVTSTNGGCFGSSDINAIAWNGLEWIIGGASGRLCIYDSTDTTPVTNNFTAIGTNTTGTTKTTLLSSLWSTNSINALCWNGSTLLIGGSAGHLDKISSFYNGSTAKSIVSKSGVYTTTGRIYSVALNVTAITNGQSLAYYVSCDGGTNWQSIQNNNNATIISNTGADLRWKVDMTGNWRTPIISNPLTLTCLTVAQSVLPAGLGGEVLYSGDNKTKISIPVGLLTADTSFMFDPIVTPPTASRAPTTAVVAYDITAQNIATGAMITEFSKSINLSLFRSSSGGMVTGTSVSTANAAASLAIAYWNGLYWIPLSTKIEADGTGFSLSAKINHLSKYAIVVASPEITAIVEPNPFTPASANPAFARTKFTFPNSDQGNAAIKIWDRNGSVIREITMDGVSQIEWDGKDTQGRMVESGVYLYEAIVGGTSRARGTVVVGR